jgi:hypothetical protein
MIERLQEILGLISGFKQKYDALKAECEASQAMIAEADSLASQILTMAQALNGTDSGETG